MSRRFGSPAALHRVIPHAGPLRKPASAFSGQQNAKQSLAIADRGYLLDNGHVVGADSAQALAKDEKVRAAYLGDG
jgi:ABC-type branched-subunit amino acid transport system ATPase component